MHAEVCCSIITGSTCKAHARQLCPAILPASRSLQLCNPTNTDQLQYNELKQRQCRKETGGMTAGGDRMHNEADAVGTHRVLTDALQGPNLVLQICKARCDIMLQVLVSLAGHQ